MTATAVAIPDTPTRPEDLERGVLTPVVVPAAARVSLPTRDEWRMLAHTANALAESGMLGKHLNGRPKAVMAVILKGRELGLPPMEALSSIYIIEGIPTLSAHLMTALVQRQSHEVWCEHTDGARAVMCGRRRGLDGVMGPRQSVEWTIEQAKVANLLNKDNWKKYPHAMLRARATTALCRMMFPDVLMGAVYSPEELGASIGRGGEVTRLPSAREAAEAAARADEAGEQSGDVVGQDALDTGDEDPAGGLHADTVDAEVVAAEDLDRRALWAELLDQARIVGQRLGQYTTRWAATYRKNIEQATTTELHALVASRRDYIADLVAKDPDVVTREPVGPQPECPVDPETGELPPVDAEEVTDAEVTDAVLDEESTAPDDRHPDDCVWCMNGEQASHSYEQAPDAVVEDPPEDSNTPGDGSLPLS